MSTPLQVSVTPSEIRVPVGSTAIFTCHPNFIYGEEVDRFSWEAAVQIANETRYSLEDDSRIVHINNVQKKDNNTDVTCRVLSSRGRKGKARARLRVEEVNSEYENPSTARPGLEETSSSPVIVASSTIGVTNGLILGSLLVVIVISVILLIALKLYGKSITRRIANGVSEESITTQRNSTAVHVAWSGKPNHGSRYEPVMLPYAELGETCSSIYEDLKLPVLIPGQSNSLPVGSGMSALGPYENLFWVVSDSLLHPSSGWDRPGCSSNSLPERYTNPHCSLATTSSCYSYIDTDIIDQIGSNSQLTRNRNSYENLIDPITQPEYENERTESSCSDVSYAVLDFGESTVSTDDPTEVDSIEYSKVQKVLSVYRSRSGSTRVNVKVIDT